MSSFNPTGDSENAFKKLARLLMRVRYPEIFARERVLEGDTSILIPMLRYALTCLSHKLARKLLNQGYAVYSTGDSAFMEAVYRVCVHSFHYYPVLSLLQFMHPPKGYAERKMAFVTNVIQCALNKHAELTREEKLESQKHQSHSSSSKKKQREESHARLTQVRAHNPSVEEQEGTPSAAASRGRSLSAFRSAASLSSSSRPRSASASGRSSLASSQRARRSSSKATRPKTANGKNAFTPSETNDGTDLYASNSNASGQGEDISIEHMSHHSVPRSRHTAHSHPSDSMRSDSGSNRTFGASVKKAFVHEHQSGSVPVSVVGYLEQQPEGSPAASPMSRAKQEALERKKQIEYSRAQDVARLKRKEEQEEQDRLKHLQLQHTEYSTQNSPHVDPNETDSHATRFRQAAEFGSSSHDNWDDAFDQQLHQSPQPYPMSQYQQLASSQGPAGHGRSVHGSPSPHLIGDEHGLNASFSRSQNGNVGFGTTTDTTAHQSNSTAGPVQSVQRPEIPKLQLSALNEQLNQIADRNHSTAKKVAQGSAKKAPRVHEGREQVPVLQFQPVQQTSAASSVRQSQQPQSHQLASDASSAAHVSSFLAGAASGVSTPLEARLFSMLESIQNKMIQMETNMHQMEDKLTKATVAAQAKEQQAAAQQQIYEQQQPQQPTSAGVPMERIHPTPNVNPTASLGVSFRSQRQGATPLLNPLVPHPLHQYTPASSFHGPPREDNVNQIGRHALPTNYVHPTSSAQSQSQQQLAQTYPHLSASSSSAAPVTAAPSSTSHSRHNSPPRYPNLHASSSTSSLTDSHSSGNWAPHANVSNVHARLYGQPHAHQRGSTPVKVPLHTPMAYPPSGGDMLPSVSPTVQMGQPASYPNISNTSDSAAVPSSVAPQSFGASSFPHSSFHVSHTSAGSAALSKETVLPTTDTFILQLKQRLKQTEELLYTTRMSAKANIPEQQPTYSH
jgi:hypothetical protein